MAAGLQGAKDPIAVAAAKAHALHFHVPVVGSAVVQVELHHPLGFQGFAVAKQQEFHPGGQGGNDREIHPPLGGGGPQGPGATEMDGGQRRQQAGPGLPQTRQLIVAQPPFLCKPFPPTLVGRR